MRIAAIDCGTNSIHMIVAEARGSAYKVVDREKDMVQLGLSSLDGQPLTEDAMARLKDKQMEPQFSMRGWLSTLGPSEIGNPLGR